MNKQITESLKTLLGQISSMLIGLTDEQFTVKLPVLSVPRWGNMCGM